MKRCNAVYRHDSSITTCWRHDAHTFHEDEYGFVWTDEDAKWIDYHYRLIYP